MRESQPKPRICVSVCVQTARDLRPSVERAAELADIIELRLDCLAGAALQDALSSLGSLASSTSRPFIITLRPAEQGGQREIDTLNRIAFWLDQLDNEQAGLELADIEFDVARVLMEKEGLDWNRVICSHHDFTGTKTNLDELYQEMAKTPARVIKLAVRVSDASDCLPIFKLLERARSEGREIIALAMGEAGIATRILGPSHGAYLTYAALDSAHSTAPGQPTAEDLRRVYRVHKITEETAIVGLVGAPVSHSISPQLHNAAFEETGTDAVYIPFEVHDVEKFVRRMAHPRSREMVWKLRGLSVTAPHKRAVMEQLDWIEPSARDIGAVNTIVVEGEELRGYNTDAVGFLLPLEKRLGGLRGKQVAIIGAGGAARSALWSLAQAGAKATVFARDVEKATRLGEAFDASPMKLEGALFHDFEVVVNATPLGTSGTSERETPAVAAQLRGARLVYDLVYNPPETRFLLEAKEAGCETLAGLEMLIAQAVEQFKLWTGRDASIEIMREAAKKALEK